ncbi:MAG: PorV/PorQ family protein [bacterium]
MKPTVSLAASLAILAFVCPSPTNAQIGSVPEAAFGAHSLALGRSAVASPHDALSSSWNPASITGLEKKTATVFLSKLPFISDAILSSYGLVIPTQKYGSFGVSFFHFGVGGITARDNDGQAIGTFSSKHDHLLFTYGRTFANALAVGFNVKFVEQSLAGLDAVSENPGIDFGMLYRLPGSQPLLKNLTMGIAIDNLAKPALKLSRQREALPRETRLMAEKEWRIGNGELTLLSNLAFPETVASRLHWGMEYSYKSAIALRSGYDGNRFSAGAGVKFKALIIDYALNDQLNESGFVSMTSAVALTYQF